jgi:hydrogenase maturation protease
LAKPSRLEGPSTLVLGLGNPLWGDDGLGVEAVKLLSGRELPPEVQVESAGMPGFALAAWLENAPQRLILVDAAHMGQSPGTWRRFDSGEVRLIARDQIISLHEADLASGLALAQALHVLPEEVSFYAVEPESLLDSMEISPSVKEILPEVVENILDELWNGGEQNE